MAPVPALELEKAGMEGDVEDGDMSRGKTFGATGMRIVFKVRLAPAAARWPRERAIGGWGGNLLAPPPLS